MAEEIEESPWDSPKPSYKAVPPLNPKTGQPVQVYACTICGAAVVSRKLHSRAHRNGTLGKGWL